MSGNEINRWIRDEMKRQGMMQKDLAGKAGIGEAMISRLHQLPPP